MNTSSAKLDVTVIGVRVKRVFLALSVFVVVGFGGLVVVSSFFPGYVDRAEPAFASVSWLLHRGMPLYHPLDSVDRYSLLYGPTCYLPFAAAFFLGPASVGSLKAALAVAVVATGWLLFGAYRTRLRASDALIAVALTIVFLMVPQPNNYFFQVRGDAFMVCATALALFGATRNSPWAGPLAVALGAAFVIDAKITGCLYVAPALVLLGERHGWQVAAATGAGVALCAILVFALPGISARNYFEWLALAKGHPHSARDLTATLKTLPLLFAPLVLSAGARSFGNGALTSHLRSHFLRIGVLGLGIVLVTAASGRIGAGSHHLLPFVPLLGYECVDLYLGAATPLRWSLGFGLFCCATALVVAVRVGQGLRPTLEIWANWERATNVESDLRAILDRYKGRAIQMGYGDVEDPVTYYRPDVVFATNRLLVDSQALTDMDTDGVPIPQATADAVASCAIDLWLIPKRQTPFAMDNVFGETYAGLRRPLFSNAFRAAFALHYSKASSTEYFDLWTCGGASALRTRGAPIPAYL